VKNYEPYDFSSLRELMQICYRMGWYSGKQTLFAIRMVGQFEGHGRASESWEHDFYVDIAEIGATPGQEVVDAIYHGSKPERKPSLQAYTRENSMPGGSFGGVTLEEACAKAVAAIKAWREEQQ